MVIIASFTTYRSRRERQQIMERERRKCRFVSKRRKQQYESLKKCTDRDVIKWINNQTRTNRQHNHFRNSATNKRDESEEIPIEEIEKVCRENCKFKVH